MNGRGARAAVTRGHQGPALSQSATLRYIIFGALYVAQGVPEGLTFFAIPAWLAMNGVDAGVIGGYLAVIVLPWSFKLFAGPVMDRYTYLPMGRRRPWVLFGQVGLMLSFLSMMWIPHPVDNIAMLTVMGFIVSFFGAAQDVATDGMAVDIIPEAEQARANGLMWGAKVVGTSSSLAAGTWMINHHGFPSAVAMLSVSIFLIMLFPLLLRERPGEKRLPWQQGTASAEARAMKVERWSDILMTLRKAFALRDSLLMAGVGFVFTTGIGLMDAMLPLFTIQEVGWTNDGYSNVLATVSFIGAFVAMAIAGRLVDRIGKVRIMGIYLFLFVVLATIMAFTPDLWGGMGHTTGLIIGYQTLYTFFMVAYLATSMNLCWKRVSATQFTMFMAMGNVGRAVGSSSLGPLREHLDWPGMFLVFALLMFLALLLTRSFRLHLHHAELDRLEGEFLDSVETARAFPDIPPDLGGPHVPR